MAGRPKNASTGSGGSAGSGTGSKVNVQVEDRQLTLTNLDKVLYPEAGFTKGEVIDYYTRIAPVLLPHLADRALTVKRYPNGVDQPSFYEKNATRGRPEWVRTVNLPAPGSTKDRESIDYVLVDGLPTLVWLANLASLELHVPQWTVHDGDITTDLIVFDLDPGPPAAIGECARVGLMLQEVLAADGLTGFAKTSGSKGMQVSVPIEVDDPQTPSTYAHDVARRLERSAPHLVVSRMTKALRGGKVLVDWSQNNPAKTTVAPYSLRARAYPTVSTPLTWDEVAAGAPLSYTAADVLGRVEQHGDLFGGTLSATARARLDAS